LPAALAGVLLSGEVRAGVTPDSPEVKKVLDAALKYLETNNEDRLGGRCLIGLAFLKAGRGEDPNVQLAVDECTKQMKANVGDTNLDMYSNGLAIIFLCEYSPKRYARQIEFYLGRLKTRQKPHGGWGYSSSSAGDTSQTQYAALSLWEANRHGFNVDGASVEKLADWLMRSQGPEGCWGYQGQVSPTDQPVQQDEATPSMLAAGLGATYICADIFGLRPVQSAAKSRTDAAEELPAVLHRVEEPGAEGETRRIRPQRTNLEKLSRTMSRAHGWMNKNYAIDIGSKCYYYLYGLERYKSFQAMFESSDDSSPTWYNDGYEFLAKNQSANGSWSGYCGPQCDTAFAVLFLLRSTQKSIHARLGEGMLLAGRGLPTNLSRAKLHNGQLIVEQVHTKVDELLSMIDDGNEGVLDDLARDPSQVVVDQVDAKSARRLQQLVHGGESQARLLAVRALGRTGNLDYVPTLLYALTDPDRRVVIEARNELCFISRNFDGFGPPDEFTQDERFKAIDNWKKWYKSIRPTAVLEENR